MSRNILGRTAVMATAAVTTLAIVAPGATANENSGPDAFAGAAKAQTLALELTAPQQLLGLLTGGSSTLELGVSLTEVVNSTVGDVSAKANLLTGLIAHGLSSTAPGSESSGFQSSDFLPEQFGIVDLGLGNISYDINEATRAVTAYSELAHLRIALDTVAGAAGAGGALDQLNSVLDTVTGEVSGVVDQLVTTLNDVVGEIESNLPAELGIDLPELSADQLDLVTSVAEAEILDIRKLWSETSVAPAGDLVRSVAKAGIVGASILGGLVEIPAWEFSAWAETAGEPGTANWGGATEKLAVNLADTEVLSLDGSLLTILGQSLDLNDPSISQFLGVDELAPLDDLVGQLLDIVGLSIDQGALSGFAAEDGSYAEATASAFSLSLAPLNGAASLPGLGDVLSQIGVASANELLALRIDLLPVTARADAANTPAVAPPPTEPPTTPVVPKLPRTGGGAAAMALGLMAMGGAGVMRRRF